MAQSPLDRGKRRFAWYDQFAANNAGANRFYAPMR